MYINSRTREKQKYNIRTLEEGSFPSIPSHPPSLKVLSGNAAGRGPSRGGGEPGLVGVGAGDHWREKVHFFNRSVYPKAPGSVPLPPKLSANLLLSLSIFLLNLPSDLVSRRKN